MEAEKQAKSLIDKFCEVDTYGGLMDSSSVDSKQCAKIFVSEQIKGYTERLSFWKKVNDELDKL